MGIWDVAICGGGAAGLAAAITIKQRNSAMSVVVIEKNERVGKKLLATGNGRCNLGNIGATADSSAYHGSVKCFLPAIWENTLGASDFFATLGLFCREDREGRLYPMSNHASSVLDALRLGAKSMGVMFLCGCDVCAIEKKDMCFHIQTGQEIVLARRVLVTTGGKAASKTGSNGNIFKVLESLGHRHPYCVPALTSFETADKRSRTLAGVRVMAEVTAYDDNEGVLGRECGEVQFTRSGLSGICVMNLTARYTQRNIKKLSLRLLPEKIGEEIDAILWQCYATRITWQCADFLTGILPKKIAIQLMQDSGIAVKMDSPVSCLGQRDIAAICACLKKWQFVGKRCSDWEMAQVTAGGVSDTEMGQDLQSLFVQGLYFAGEIVDLHGECGGYNLEWAWRSGQWVAYQVGKM